jgi:hypothetical protein
VLDGEQPTTQLRAQYSTPWSFVDWGANGRWHVLRREKNGCSKIKKNHPLDDVHCYRVLLARKFILVTVEYALLFFWHNHRIL